MLVPVNFDRARFRSLQFSRIAFGLLGGAALGGCFSPDADSPDDTGSGSTDTSATSPSSSADDSPTMSATEGMTAPADSTSMTDAMSTGEETADTASDESSTGDVSNCPGGDPTPGEAPYVVTTVAAAEATDDADVGDIDGDGHLDLISLSREGTSVETLWGDGAGGFTSDGVTVLDVDGFPDTVRIGAIADDTLDLFVHMEGPVELWVVRGDGAGNWPSPQVYTGTYVRAIDLADLNADGVLDLAYVGASNLEVRLGQATEMYEPPVFYGDNIGNVVRTADLTGDGNLDIMTAGYGANELQIYAGAGDGTFQEEPTLVTGSPISGIDVGHLDADDHLDLVLTTEDDLRVFYGEDDGGISSTPGTVIDGSLGRVRVADIDADGVEDLITHAFAAIEIRFSAGDESFADPVDFDCPAGPRNVEVGDFNEDCIPDLVAPLGPGQDLCVLMSDRE
jgi:hypothetical protein